MTFRLGEWFLEDFPRFGLCDALIVGMLFVLAQAYFMASTPQFLDLRDEGHILELSRRMSAGEIPHRDTTDVYGPGVYAVTAAALAAGDNKIMAVRRVLAALRASAVVAAYLLSRYIVPTPFALITATISLIYWGRQSWNLNAPYAALFTVPLCLLSCLFLVEALRRESRHWYFQAGLVAGSAILFKQTLAIPNVYLLAVALWAASVLRDPVSARRGGTFGPPPSERQSSRQSSAFSRTFAT